MTPKQANHLQPMTSHQLALISKNPDDAEAVLNQFFQDPATNPRGDCTQPMRHVMTRRSSTRSKNVSMTRSSNGGRTRNWIPLLAKIKREKFLANFQWDQSILNSHEKRAVEPLLVKYHGIFDRHRLDIGINTDFKIMLTLSMTSKSMHKACRHRRT